MFQARAVHLVAGLPDAVHGAHADSGELPRREPAWCCCSGLTRLSSHRCLLLQCLARPKPIIVGYLAQYLVKPFLGFLIAKVTCCVRGPSLPACASHQLVPQILNLSPPLATGLILVSCCPGGQVSHKLLPLHLLVLLALCSG